jgi:hypothetical protein
MSIDSTSSAFILDLSFWVHASQSFSFIPVRLAAALVLVPSTRTVLYLSQNGPQFGPSDKTTR